MTESQRELKPRALRVAVPDDSRGQRPLAPRSDDPQRLHARTSTAHAVELPGHLTASRPSPDASNRHLFGVEWFEERAAIMEYDGGLTRAEAEKAAMKLLRAAGVT